MLRKFTPILYDIPAPFCEDVYLADKRGRIIASRQGTRRNFDNIFSIIEKEDLEFIHQNVLFFGFQPFLAVKSTRGLMLIDISLVFETGVLVAIIPHLSSEDALSLINTNLKRIVLPSPCVSEMLKSVGLAELTLEQKNLEEIILAIHCPFPNFDTHGKTNVEIVDIMLDMARRISKFVGCALEINVHGMGIFEIKNELSLSLYKYMLLLLCFAVRNYSENIDATLDIRLDEMGPYVDLTFELASDFKREGLDLYDFMGQFDGCTFDVNWNGCVFSVRVYPWQQLYDQEHLKKDPKQLNYEKL